MITDKKDRKQGETLRHSLGRTLAVSTALPMIVVAGSAVAQNSTASTDPASPAALDNVIEEVVVTARFREESLQDSPLAITALSADSLESKGFEELQDIGASVPNAFIRPGNAATGPSPTIGLRGVQQVDFNYALEPGVAVYIDDIYHGTLTGASLDLLDIERVEVLRGPQGTLFGKNSLGGAIRFISKRPTNEFEGYVEATYGSYDRTDLRATVNIPVVQDRLFLRASGASRHRDGYQEQLDFRCQMIANGTPELAGIGDGVGADGAAGGGLDGQPDMVVPGSAGDNDFSFPSIRPTSPDDCQIGTLGGQDLQAGRVALRWLPGDRLAINLQADYSNDESEAVPMSLLTADTAARTDGFRDTVYRNFGIGYDDRFLIGDPYQTFETFADPINGSVFPNAAAIEAWGVSGDVEYDLSDSVQATVVLGHRRYDSHFTSQADGSPLTESVLFNDLSHRQTTAELQLSGTVLDGRLEWTAGGFYYDAHSYLGGRAELYTSGLLFDNNDNFDTTNKSGFLHLVFGATNRLSFTGGIRYTDEKKAYQFDHTGFLTVDEPAVASDGRFDWKAGIDFQATEDVLLYTSVATGFRSAGFQPRPFTEIQLLPFPQEELVSYDVGLKTEWFDRRLTVNAAAFYSDYSTRIVQARGVQCEPDTVEDQEPYLGGPVCPPGTFFAGGGLPWYSYISGPAKITGFELEMSAQPIDGLLVNGTLGYTHFKSEQDDPTAPNYIHPDVLVQPEWNASLGAQYRVDAGDWGSLTPRLDWFYQSKMTYPQSVTQPVGPTDIIGGYSVFNARLTYESPDRLWSLALAATNLTDERYFYSYRGNDLDGREGVPSRPREWSLTLKRQF